MSCNQNVLFFINAGAIVYGKTVSSFITKEIGFLSYPSSSMVVVYSKEVDYKGLEFWEAEVSGKWSVL